MMTIAINVVLGFLPTLILGASIAAGIDDDRRHRRVFLLVYGFWALTLAMWNWISSAHIAWAIVWGVAGIIALGALMVTRAVRAPNGS
jgi:hypothetical protein